MRKPAPHRPINAWKTAAAATGLSIRTDDMNGAGRSKEIAVRHDSHRAPARFRPTWAVLTLAALLTVPLLAAPVGAAPPATSITDVTITGTVVAQRADGPESCLWRMEVTIENFHGGGKYLWASLGSAQTSGYMVTPKTYVKGKVTSFVWETTAPLTHFPTVDTWVVRADNKKGPQGYATGSQANIGCGT